MRIIGRGGGGADDAEALSAMFVARREVFVDLLGWKVPVIAGIFELDRFDDPHARYAILLDNKRRHRASARLLSTERPHILDTLYPDLCDDAPPRGPDILEITRFCLDRHQTAAERRVARNRLVSGLAISALTSGIRCYTGVADVHWFQQILEFGWRCRPLGRPRQYAGQELIALGIDIDDDTMDRLTATGIYDPNSSEQVRALATTA